MAVRITFTQEFRRAAKHLNKKYKPFAEDLAVLLASLTEDPYQGAELGKGLRKVRMQIKEKTKGKSGGCRVITYSVNVLGDAPVTVQLITIYDKAEIPNISSSFLDQILLSQL